MELEGVPPGVASDERAIMITLAISPFIIIYVNPSWEELSGWSLEETRGRASGSLLEGPETAEASSSRLYEALEKQQSVRLTVVHYKF